MKNQKPGKFSIKENLPELLIFIQDMLNLNPLLRPTIFDLSNEVNEMTSKLLK